MKLYITEPSPFARRCRIVAREKGLGDRIEEIIVDPYTDDQALVAVNPIVQVPTLIADDGLPLTDSPVICEYLDSLAGQPILLPTTGAERLRVRRIETLADAALDVGVKLVIEKRRADGERSPSWMERWSRNMLRALDALEAQSLDGARPDMGVIAVGVAIRWIDFRHPELEASASRPRLRALSDELERRPSFQATRPG